MLRRHVLWEAEGVESSVALNASSGLSFVVNGKVDGNTRGDAGTQVMSGMIGAFIHPNPKRTMVIGLGTGSTAGWLGSISSMERVDVVELEEAILHVADACSAVNQNVLKNPKVHVEIADAREALLTGREQYDLIFSEPSNPYRAGIASLFAQEFYRAAVSRLRPGGLFLQWVQTYDIDPQSVQTVFATLGSVFPHVDAWSTQNGDMLLVAAMQPITIDVALLQQRVTMEPFRSALANAWGVDSAEGMLSRFRLNGAFAHACLEAAAPISTDDRNYLEFGFARHVGRGAVGDWDAQIHALSSGQRWHRPLVMNGEVDWEKVDAHRFSRRAQGGMKTLGEPGESSAAKARREWTNLYVEGNLRGAGEYWQKHPMEPLSPYETQMLALTLATIEAPEASRYIEAARAVRRADGDALDALAHARERNWESTVQAMERAFTAWHSEPWSENHMVQRTLDLASSVMIETQDTAIAERIYAAVREPFATYALEASRLTLAVAAASASVHDSVANVRGIMEKLEPNPIWTKSLLELRAKTYRVTKHPRLRQALGDYKELLKHEVPEFREGLKLVSEKPTASASQASVSASGEIQGDTAPRATASAQHGGAGEVQIGLTPAFAR
jgi:spermidine synthase